MQEQQRRDTEGACDGDHAGHARRTPRPGTDRVDIFRGRSPDENLQRVFGGQVAGQALVAAGRTVPPDRPVRWLHACFIRPGDPDLPIVYTVDRIRDGRSFTTRRVVAVQHGRAIFALSASFQVAETGPEYQSPMPESAVMAPGDDEGHRGLGGQARWRPRAWT